MKKPLSIILIVILVIVVIVIGILIIFDKPSQTVEESEVLYTLTYNDMMIPGSRRDIQIYNERIEITTTWFCSAVDCDAETEKETFEYSKDNTEKLINYLKNNFSTSNIELYENELTERQREVIQGLLFGEYFFEISVEEYRYKIEYSKSDSLSYIIYFKNDGSVLVKKLKINSDYDIVGIDTYSLDFSKENLSILNEYIEKEVKDENSNIILKDSTLRKDEVGIYNSIVENDSSYLSNEVKLLYTISYDGLNCLTPSLYLYSDNTYEYYYTFTTEGEKAIPKTGTYNYDITKIIGSIDKYEKNELGPYYIKEESGNNYVTYNTNKELQELLSSLDITLEKCLEQQ